MGIFSRFFKKENDPPQIITKSSSVGYAWFENRDKLSEIAGFSGSAIPRVTVHKAFKAYQSWVYDAVNLIQRKIVQTNYYLFRETGQPNDEEFDRILEHPLIRLLRRPNKFQSGREFKQITQLHLDLTGMAFWLILYNGAGVPGELHILSPSHLVNIFRGDSTERIIDKFSFAPPMQRQLARTYPYEQIVYFHYPDPEDPIMPRSPLQSLAHIIDLDLLLQIYEKDFFGNNARPDGVLRTTSDVMQEEAERIEEAWNAKHRGPGKQSKIALLTNGLEYQPIGMSAKDFEFQALAEYVKNQILASYGIPEAELGLFQSFNKASSISSETKFVKGCIEPRLKLWEDVINTQLLPLYQSSQYLEFRHESALPKDDEWQLAETQGYLGLGMTTINEQRKKQGLKPFPSPLCDVPWGPDGAPIRGVNPEADKIWDEKMAASMGAGAAAMGGIPPGAEEAPMFNAPAAQGAMGQLGGRPEGPDLTVFLQSAIKNSNQGMATLLNAARGKRGGLSALLANHPDQVALSDMLDKNKTDQALTKLLSSQVKSFIEDQLDENDKVIFKIYEDMIEQIDPLEEEYCSSMENLFVNKGIELSGLTEKMLNDFVQKGDEIFDENKFREEVYKNSESYIYKTFNIGFNGGLELVRKAGVDALEDPEKHATQYAGKLLDKSTDLKVSKTKALITDIIKEGIESGSSTEDVADQIQAAFGSFSGGRSMMIARTEMAAAMIAGQDASFRAVNQQGLTIKEAKVWSSLDERLCKECKAVHDHTAIDYKKNKTIISLPIHPNCRCALMPII